jgi:hypothetical protein
MNYSANWKKENRRGKMVVMRVCLRLIVLAIVLVSKPTRAAGTKVSLDENGVLVVDGRKTFVFSFSLPPPPGGKTPEGRDAFEELKDAGVNFMRVRPTTGPQDYTEEGIRAIKPWLDEAASHKMHCWVTLGKLPSLMPGAKGEENEKLLRLAIELYKDHPGLAVWKGFDEPAWVKMPAEPLVESYKLFKKLDPDHPVIIIQAPTKASLPLEPYAAAGDIFGVDIYPVTYPPGKHSDFGNPDLSVVADCAKWIGDAVKPKPIWMTLQIAWAGTATPGKTLRFPSFFEQRYMAYAVIVNGARGVNFQGGERPLSLTERDLRLGWNWTYWKKVMRPLAEELGEKSPLQPALMAADSRLRVKASGAEDIELRVREVGRDVFVIATKRGGETVKVQFSGLPTEITGGDVMFEEPRKVQVKSGVLEDWFAPHDVHVYHLPRG